MTTIADCCRAAIETHGISVAEFKRDRPDRRAAWARYAAMWLARAATTQNHSAIGRRIGRDHSVVFYGIKRAHQLMRTDAEFCRRLQAGWRLLRRG